MLPHGEGFVTSPIHIPMRFATVRYRPAGLYTSAPWQDAIRAPKVHPFVVQFQAHISQVHIVQTSLNDFKRRHLFGDKHHLLALLDWCGDKIRDRLRLASPRSIVTQICIPTNAHSVQIQTLNIKLSCNVLQVVTRTHTWADAPQDKRR